MRFMLDCSPLVAEGKPNRNRCLRYQHRPQHVAINSYPVLPFSDASVVPGARFWDRRRPRLPVLHLRCSSCTGAGEDACGPEERAREFQGVTKRVRMRTYSWLVGFNVRFVPARDTCSHSFRCRRPSTTFVFPEWTAIIKNRIDHPPGRFYAFITGEQGVVTT